jgi:hypothetical protein
MGYKNKNIFNMGLINDNIKEIQSFSIKNKDMFAMDAEIEFDLIGRKGIMSKQI